MLRGSELGLSPIKCLNREGTDKIKKIHYEINDLLYKYNRMYIAPRMGYKIFNSLCSYGEELKNLDVGPKAEPKRKELLEKVRDIAKRIRAYYSTYNWTDEDMKQVRATLSYRNFKMTEEKKATTSVRKVIENLDLNKEIWQSMVLDPGYTDKIDGHTFRDFQKELLQKINGKYAI